MTAPKKGSESPTRMANSGHGEEELCVRDLQSLTCRIWYLMGLRGKEGGKIVVFG